MPSAQRNGATQLTEAVRLHVKSAVLRPKQMPPPPPLPLFTKSRVNESAALTVAKVVQWGDAQTVETLQLFA